MVYEGQSDGQGDGGEGGGARGVSEEGRPRRSRGVGETKENKKPDEFKRDSFGDPTASVSECLFHFRNFVVFCRVLYISVFFFVSLTDNCMSYILVVYCPFVVFIPSIYCRDILLIYGAAAGPLCAAYRYIHIGDQYSFILCHG